MNLGISLRLSRMGRSGLNLGPERLTNGDFSAGSTGWSVVNDNGTTHTITFSGGTARYQSTTTTPVLTLQQLFAYEVGKTYRIEVEISAHTSGFVKTDASGFSINFGSAVGTYVGTGVATGTTFNITRGSANVDQTITRISVREVL